jgi:hypothetical protein
MARHLSREEIWDIIRSSQAGESKGSIARRHDVDHSTVIYHLDKYHRAYPEESSVYAVIKVQARKTCTHPSAKCTLCGRMEDKIKREERRLIRELTERLARANKRLTAAGLAVE